MAVYQESAVIGKSAATGAARNEAPRGSDLLRAIGDLRHKQDISSFFSSLLF
jgi:hypothetical protein